MNTLPLRTPDSRVSPLHTSHNKVFNRITSQRAMLLFMAVNYSICDRDVAFSTLSTLNAQFNRDIKNNQNEVAFTTMFPG